MLLLTNVHILFSVISRVTVNYNVIDYYYYYYYFYYVGLCLNTQVAQSEVVCLCSSASFTWKKQSPMRRVNNNIKSLDRLRETINVSPVNELI